MLPPRFSRILLSMAGIVGLVATSLGGYAGYLQLTGNFHPVIEGQLYRSAQPSGNELAAYIKTHNIKTVINLRGFNPDKPWYQDEIAVADRLGVKHIDFGISASKIVRPDKADQLVSIMAAAEKPILVHCQGGADRSGLAAALYSRAIARTDSDTAEGQLSFYYGHVGLPILSDAYAMDRSLEQFEEHSVREARADLHPPAKVR